MARNRAELIFVAGPQQGERNLLMTATVVIGRHPSCDIQIIEQTVSRQQAQVQLSPHGWVVVSLASSPIRINGKRYRAAQQIILDTGDILGVGLETEMLFVAQGDDVEAALGQMRETYPQFASFAGVSALAPDEPAGPAPTPKAMPIQAAHAPPPPRPPVPEAIHEPAPMDVIVADQDEALADEVAEAERVRKAKLRKYLVGFGIYGALFVGFIVAMSLRPTGDDEIPKDLKRLSDSKIRTILTKDLAIKPREIHAEEMLNKARRHYDDYPQRPESMYMAVKHFQIYLAFTGDNIFPDTKDLRLYQDAKVELVKSVTAVYRRAWKETKNEDWNAALRDFELVQRMIPVKEGDYPDLDNELFLNVREFIKFVRGRLADKPSRRF